jgi:hypothetical protein
VNFVAEIARSINRLDNRHEPAVPLALGHLRDPEHVPASGSARAVAEADRVRGKLDLQLDDPAQWSA